MCASVRTLKIIEVGTEVENSYNEQKVILRI